MSFECTSLKWVQASDVPPFFDFISSWCSWRKSTTLPLKCFQTKPIKQIMQIIWKCAPLTVWTATDNQTIALWCLVLLCTLQLYGCSVSGGFFWKQIDMIHIQTVFFFGFFPVACPKRKRVSGCKDDSCIFFSSVIVFILSASHTDAFEMMFCGC